MPKYAFTFGIFFLSLLFVVQSCTEPYVPETETFEDLLVVEATITNELKKHEVKLTRTYRFEEIQPEIVDNAEVVISDNTGIQYSFQFKDSVYVSVMEFQAKPGIEYTLEITTNKGQTYNSTPEILPTINQLSINVDKKEVDGQFGAQISVDSYDPENSSHYYRYEYQETFKVIPPYWGPHKAILLDKDTLINGDRVPVVDYVLRDNPQTRVCYDTQYSKDIKLLKTTNLAEDRVEDFPIRFISRDSYMLTHKYSIQIKQYVESYEAYIFYRTLKKVSGEVGTVLSPNQPGFVAGNLSAVGNSDKNVVGYFDVASVSSQRIFLQHETLFPEALNPPYFANCFLFKLDKNAVGIVPDPQGYTLRQVIRGGSMLLYRVINDLYIMTPPQCTDCTTFASNKKPEFWP